MMVTNSSESHVQLNEEPESSKLAISQLLEQLEKRNQRLSLLRSENEQLTQQLAQREHALRISQSQIRELGQRRATVDSLETSLREHEEQIEISDERNKELQRQIQELKKLSTQLAEKDGALQTSSAELAKQNRGLQSQVERAEERVGVISAQLLDTEAQLKRITDTLGWRLLSHYGRIKYRYLLPIYRLFGQIPAEWTKSNPHGALDRPLEERSKSEPTGR